MTVKRAFANRYNLIGLWRKPNGTVLYNHISRHRHRDTNEWVYSLNPVDGSKNIARVNLSDTVVFLAEESDVTTAKDI